MQKRFVCAIAAALALSACATSAGPPVAQPVERPDRPAACIATDPEVSDFDIEVESAIFGTTERAKVHLTPCVGETSDPLPVLYLLHGAGADETQWPDIGMFTAIDDAVNTGRFPQSIIVIPDAAPAYSCSDCADALAAHILNEIEPAVEAIRPVDGQRRAIGGISRGGGLALQVAGSNPSAFIAVGAHSAVTAPNAALRALAEHDISSYLDVGTEDSLAPATEAMAERLTKLDAPLTLEIGPGGHDRDYWRSHVGAYAAFYGSALDQTR